MKRTMIVASCLAGLLSMGCGARAAPAAHPAGAASRQMYQYSVIDALLAGVFDGELTCGALKQHGDLGIGAFNALDGELLVYGGEVYRIRGDGSVSVAADTDRTSLSMVTFFQPTETITLEAGSMDELKAALGRRLRPNRAYAIELRGRFAMLTARAPDAASKPYPGLAAHLTAHQHNFPLADTTGVAVGFWLPPYLAHVNVPGLHLHYLTDDHRAGGHVLDVKSGGPLAVRVMELSGVTIELGTDGRLDGVDLSGDRREDLQRVESGSPKR